MITLLWSLCKPNASDSISIQLTNSALKSLSKFKKSDFKVSQLPINVMNLNKINYFNIFFNILIN